MKWQSLVAAVLGTAGVLAGCSENPVPQVAVPRQDDATAYRPVPQPKPLPPNGAIVGGVPQLAPPPGQPGQAVETHPSDEQRVEPITPASPPPPAAPQQ